ncbi:hypothetical protein [Streptomyces rubiginosohelvolus]|uniref:hypothetical protein n=1 Tax=Streptomyces rubiginosohelvolus TaxID=67362 RepID=UPI00364C2CF4
MSTETIGTAPTPTPEPPTPSWMRGLQLATNATWKAIGIPAEASPFCVTQNDMGDGEHTGHVHYLLLAPLLEIAEAYDAPVTETKSLGGGTTYSVAVPVDGVTVTIWTTDPADAPAVAE